MNYITLKIDRMRADRQWSVYKLSQESNLPAPTIRKWFQSDMFPSIPALTQICKAFGITLADFFSEGNLIDVTPNIKALYDAWCVLSSDERASIESIINNYINKK